MHKLFLTETECGIIEGADKIISAVGGGFPSMENGMLIQTSIEVNRDKPYLHDVFLTFDISGWKKAVKYYEDSELGTVYYDENGPSIISLRFTGAREVFIDYDSQGSTSEAVDIYFSNTADRTLLFRDGLPGRAREIPRPFTCFYLAARQLIIEFFEDECRIFASLEPIKNNN